MTSQTDPKNHPASLDKKLMRYAVVAGAALAASQTQLHADSVVIPYTPPIDASSSGDANFGNGVDFFFSGFGGSGGCGAFEVFGGCFGEVAVNGGCGCGNFLDQLQSGDTVDDSLTYSNFGSSTLWSPAGDGYLGFNFPMQDGTHYGYFTIDPFQVVSATYNSTPNVGIQIGAPEPGTLAMLALGAAAAGLIRRRRKA